MGFFFGKKKNTKAETPQEAIPVPEPEPVSKYASMTREEKEAALIDTIYEMAERIEHLEGRIHKLEAKSDEIRDIAEEARYYAHCT